MAKTIKEVEEQLLEEDLLSLPPSNKKDPNFRGLRSFKSGPGTTRPNTRRSMSSPPTLRLVPRSPDSDEVDEESSEVDDEVLDDVDDEVDGEVDDEVDMPSPFYAIRLG